jgi:Putative metallopeptidase
VRVLRFLILESDTIMLKFWAAGRASFWFAAAVFSAGILLPSSASAQAPVAAAPAPPTQMQIDDAARMLLMDPALEKVPPQEGRSLIQFVGGNLFFATMHELGHAHVSQMEMPVLGREEDAADAYAILALIKLGTMMSVTVLEESAMGWFLMARKDEKEGGMPLFYDDHGLDKQRAYQIVCFMVGSDPEKFKSLAERAKLPVSRRKTCKGDYEATLWSWDQMLQPHRLKEGQPETKINIVYEAAEGRFAAYAQAFQALHFLELVAIRAHAYAWPHPLSFEMRKCGRSNATWISSQRKVLVCYEFAAELAELYRDYGGANAP